MNMWLAVSILQFRRFHDPRVQSDLKVEEPWYGIFFDPRVIILFDHFAHARIPVLAAERRGGRERLSVTLGHPFRESQEMPSARAHHAQGLGADNKHQGGRSLSEQPNAIK
jgi:hypothetical protein